MPNRLAQETSPYLLQHADNPVDWYPWGPEALALARAEDRPLLVSIGYSACHWCHVMAHESFEDPEVAAVMNRLFVNVKVDREERPDLDRIYQLAHQMLSRRPGGWPLTVILTPEQVPFFAGTYFPKAPRYNLPGFAQLLENVAAIWSERRGDIERQNRSLLEAFASMRPRPASPGAAPGAAALDAALAEASASFDERHGGFGGAPKFPHTAQLELCLRRHARTGDARALHMVVHTLERMAGGGLYDQLGGGFCRYSVDERWEIPHFEKMLYDNGPLLGLYADAWCATGSARFAQVVRETAGWIMREMQGPHGGYYSSLDADSEHEEGRFYVWDRAEVATLLAPEEYAVAAAHFGLESAPNFEGRHWHLRIAEDAERVAARLAIAPGEAARLLASARARLLAVRERRVHPGRDEKILAAWNGLAIRGMARAGSALGESGWIDSARAALEFVRSTLWRGGRLLATAKDGRAHLNAYLDDHAFVLAGAIELLCVRFDRAVLDFACELAEVLLAQFEDAAGGGFFFTSGDHERLIERTLAAHDDSMPSGNAVAALALNRLAALTGQSRYASAAARTVLRFDAQMNAQPGGYSSMLAALEEQLDAPRTVVITGPREAAQGWHGALGRRYLPDVLAVVPDPASGALPPPLAKPRSDRATAWLCAGASCLAPIDSAAELDRALDQGRMAARSN